MASCAATLLSLASCSTGNGGNDGAADTAPDVPVEEDYLIPVDSGPFDANVSDAALDAAHDAAVDAPPAGDGSFLGGGSRCATSGYLLCEDFESGTWNATLWTPHMSSGTMIVDAMHVARGSHALHIQTMTTAAVTTGSNVGLTSTHGFPVASNTYWGRAFVYLAGTAAPTTHTTLFESSGSIHPDGGTFNVSQRFSISGGKLDASYDTSPRPPTTDYAHRSATGMPLNRWACLEWEFKGDTNEVHYYLDDAELMDMRVLPTAAPQWTAPSWTHVQVGLQLYQHDVVNTFDMWLDEVAINTTRIRCEN